MGFLKDAAAKNQKKLEESIKKELEIAKRNGESFKPQLEPFIVESESIEQIYSSGMDFCAFTNKRIIFVDRKLISSKKSVTSVFYSKINFVAFQQGGTFSISKEVILGVSGNTLSIETWSTAVSQEIYREINKRIV